MILIGIAESQSISPACASFVLFPDLHLVDPCYVVENLTLTAEFAHPSVQFYTVRTLLVY